MIKYFTTRFGTNPEINEQLLKLRQAFPGFYYSAGKRKDASGIYVIKDLKTKEYAEPITIEGGDLYWGPVAQPLTISKFKSNYQERINVTLSCGLEIEIFPASCEPKKVLLSQRKLQVTEEVYNKSSEYGMLAFKLFERAQVPDAKISLSDPEYLDFVAKSLEISYTLPSLFWDDVITTSDLDSIFSAAMGIDPKEMKSEVQKKSTLGTV